MPQLADAQRFVELSVKAKNLAELELLVESMTLEMGFHFYALVQHVDIRTSNTRETVWLENYPASWAEVFVETGLYANDPIHLASQRRTVGFVWSEVGSFMKLVAPHKRVLAQARQEGLGDGYTIPAHLPGESNGSCSFAVKRGHDLPRKNLMVAQLVGTFAFEAARKKAMQQAAAAFEKPRLTGRQLDCLVHVAHGKSDWEIAKILGIKESTVRGYVDEACERYGVGRRVQLVVRALHDGQMTLRDALG